MLSNTLLNSWVGKMKSRTKRKYSVSINIHEDRPKQKRGAFPPVVPLLVQPEVNLEPILSVSIIKARKLVPARKNWYKSITNLLLGYQDQSKCFDSNV